VLETLITSRTRLKMLLRFFLNAQSKAHLRGLAEEFGESTNAIRQELNNLSKAGYLVSKGKGNLIEYSANVSHPLYPDLQRIIHKYLGVDKILDKVVNKVLDRLGDLSLACITGDYANGKDTGIIDLVLVGNIDARATSYYTRRVEKLIARKIRLLVLSTEELEKNRKSLQIDTALCLWRKE
jgi:hypothetical protein